MSIGTALLLGRHGTLAKEQLAHLSGSGIDVTRVEASSQALRMVERDSIDVVMIDASTSEQLGVEIFEALKRIDPALPVIMVEDDGENRDSSWIDEKYIFDYLPKSADVDSLLRRVRLAVNHHKLTVENRRLNQQLKTKQSATASQPYQPPSDVSSAAISSETLIGRSPAIERVRRELEEAAQTDISVLLEGETGTGKDVAARLIHTLGQETRGGAFVKICCPALPEQLLESELFGHEAGAFTGALNRKPGRMELAVGGTTFLDEITEMSSGIQAKLLEVLEHKTFTRVGGTESITVDTRLIAATNVQLDGKLDTGLFRPDLYFRMSQYRITMPTLRERPEDLPQLVDHFMKKYRALSVSDELSVSPKVMAKLVSYTWPGNVRELESAVKRYVISGNEQVLYGSFLNADDTAPGTGELGMYKESEKRLILSALSETRWNRRQASKLLGMSYNTLRRRIERYKLNATATV